jgi:hypothetical protein
MATSDITHFIFVDFENVQEVDLSPIAGQAVQVTLLLGKNQTKIDLELVKQIQQFGTQVKLIEVGGSGRNALDLTLACYLGRAIEQVPEANFAIVSKDKDFAPMVAHLVAQKITVARHDSFRALPFLTHRKQASPPKIVQPAGTKLASAKKASVQPKANEAESANSSLQADRFEKLIARLRNDGEPRPKTRKRLLAKIATDFGGKLSESECILKLDELVRRGGVAIDANDKVSYPAG